MLVGALGLPFNKNVDNGDMRETKIKSGEATTEVDPIIGNPTVTLSQTREVEEIEKRSVWRRTTNCPAMGEAVMFTDALIERPFSPDGELLYWPKGWYNIGMRLPGDGDFHENVIVDFLRLNPVRDEMQARNVIVLEALGEMRGRYYPDDWNFAPFECWHLTIACASREFLDCLADAIKERSNLSNCLRNFSSVAVANVPKGIARLAHNERPIDANSLRALRR